MAHAEQNLMHYSLVIPLIFNAAFCILYFWGLDSASALINDQDRLAREANLELPYDMRPLRYFLILLGVVFALMACGLGFLLIRATLTNR